ncbi:hypothetical protein [Paenibacillus athensensis]|uniref:hypothetical protein n=1 Tax=Paenibacillus athensensis TaxID=1967502 RepID=UPI001ADDBB8C|nr:hypothetical protein [Paenibacillus athensensis]
MATLFFFLTAASIVLLLVGLIKPGAVLYGKAVVKKSRKRVLLYYGLSMVAFFVAFVIALPESSVPQQSSRPAAQREADASLPAAATAQPKQHTVESSAPQPTNEPVKPRTDQEADASAATSAPTSTPKPQPQAGPTEVPPSLTTDPADAQASFWKRAAGSVSRMFRSAAAYVQSDDPFHAEKQQFSEDELHALLQREQVYLTLEDKWFGPDAFKRLPDAFDAVMSGDLYLYAGDMKGDRPQGKGILFTETDSSITYGKVFTLAYVGYFDQGVFSGYGMKYEKASNFYNDEYTSRYTRGSTNGLSLDQLGIGYPEYEGYFTKGKPQGHGKQLAVKEHIDNYTPTLLVQYQETNAPAIADLEREIADDSSPLIHISQLPPLDTYVVYEGEFKKGKFHGKGTRYDSEGSVVDEGVWKNGSK